MANAEELEDDLIYGEYHKDAGNLRIIDGRDDVKNPELFIYWNKQGPQRRVGPAGPIGA